MAASKRKKWPWIVGIIVAVPLMGAVYVYQQVTHLEVEQLTPDLHVLRGMGGNVAVLKTGEGAVVVDTMTFPLQGERIQKKAQELTGEAVVMIINSHYHLDHSHGNPAFSPDTRVVSTDKTLEHMHNIDAEFWVDDAIETMPNETFTEESTIRLGNKTIRLIHPGCGHTDGDLVAFFVEDRTIHMGDLYFEKHYPNIDLEAGGSAQEWAATMDNVLSLEFDHAIPGHGATSDANGMRAFQQFMIDLAEVGRDAAERQLTLEETIAQADFTSDEGFKPIKMIIDVGLDREFVIGRAWEEATGQTIED